MEDGGGHGSNTFLYNQLLFHPNQQQDMLMQPPVISSSAFNPTYGDNHFLIPPPPSYSYGCTYSDDQLYKSSGNLTDDQETLLASSSWSGPAGRSSVLSSMLSHEFEKMKSMNVIEDKALAASRSHSEAERRRRERINSHLTHLRSLLPNTTKTDKASLLAEVIQHVKDLKQQTSALPELSTVPTDFDELTFDTCTTEDGKLLIKASFCCDDRSDILQDLIKTCQAQNLRTVKADLATLAGRMKYVVFIAGDPDQGDDAVSQPFVRTVQEAFKSVMGRSLRKLDEKGHQLDPCSKRRRVKESRLSVI